MCGARARRHAINCRTDCNVHQTCRMTNSFVSIFSLHTFMSQYKRVHVSGPSHTDSVSYGVR